MTINTIISSLSFSLSLTIRVSSLFVSFFHSPVRHSRFFCRFPYFYLHLFSSLKHYAIIVVVIIIATVIISSSSLTFMMDPVIPITGGKRNSASNNHTACNVCLCITFSSGIVFESKHFTAIRQVSLN